MKRHIFEFIKVEPFSIAVGLMSIVAVSNCGGNGGAPPSCALDTPRYGTLTGSDKFSYNDNKAAGTLGLIVHDRATGRPMALTNCHVLAHITNDCPVDWYNSVKDHVFDEANSLKHIGTPARGDGQNGYDWGLLNISFNGWNYNSNILQKPDGSFTLMPEITGIAQTTGPRHVKMIDQHMGMSTATLLTGFSKAQVMTDPFFYFTEESGGVVGGPGDSGSIILDYDTNEAVGLWYQTIGADNKTAQANYLQGVLDKAMVRYYDPKNNPVGFFRYRNKAVDDVHLYTTDWGELALGDGPWIFDSREGAMFKASPTKTTKASDGTDVKFLPFSRFVNNDQDYLYTTDPASEPGIAGYCPQGFVGFIPDKPIDGQTTTLYRYINSKGHHFYTTRPEEATDGWTPDSPSSYLVFVTDGPPDPPTLYQGPADAEIAIDPTCSTAKLTVGNDTGETKLSGLVNLTVGPQCTDPVCSLSISSINLTGPNFNVGTDEISQIAIKNSGYALGSWTIDNTFTLPTQSTTILAKFTRGGINYAFTANNTSGPLHGTVKRDYSSELTMEGVFTNPNGSLLLSLCGHVVGHPPVAALTPPGPFECDSPNGAQVTFSSAQSSDPENDITYRRWKVDNIMASMDGLSISPTLSIGSHSVSVEVQDSRGATSTASEDAIVRDTTPPVLTPTFNQGCIWPPNHKFALYTLNNDVFTNVVDKCDPSPSVRVVNVTSNQPPTGGGSGNSPVDIKFGPHAFCVRAERDGTLSTTREYTVTFEAVDKAGNKTSQQAVISVPHDQSGGVRCDMPANVVSDDDARCTQ